MSTPSLHERHESGPDDPYERRREWEISSKAHLQDDGSDASSFHILRKWERGVEAVQFYNPLGEICNRVEVHVPPELMERHAALQGLKLSQLKRKSACSRGIHKRRRFKTWER